jgi:hypothetical protein
MRVQLGNLHPIHTEGPSVTTITLPDDEPNLLDITNSGGAWENQSHDLRPAWVECSVLAVALDLAEHYGIRVGRPDDWKDTP